MSKMGVDRDSVTKLSEEAALAPTRFNATERSAFIKTNVEKIIVMIKNKHSMEDIKSIFPDFCEQYPSLLEMISRPSFDEKSLGLMIRMLEKMGNGNASQHEASIQVGQHLLNAYVKPQLNQ